MRKKKPLTREMAMVLVRAKALGGVVAGRTVDRLGRIVVNNPSSVLALERRGLVRTKIGPDGGMAAELTADGRNTVVLLESGNGLLFTIGMQG